MATEMSATAVSSLTLSVQFGLKIYTINVICVAVWMLKGCCYACLRVLRVIVTYRFMTKNTLKVYTAPVTA